MLSLVNEGYITQDMVIHPIEISSEVTRTDYRLGVVRDNITYGTRNIDLKILFIASDQLDFALKRDKLFGIFSDTNPFYIYEGRPTDRTEVYGFEKPGEKYGQINQLPSNIERIKGKRYYVIRENMSEVSQNGLLGSCDITLQTYQIPFAESSGTSLDPQNTLQDVWQTGQGLMANNPSSRKYIFENVKQFNIFNAGNVSLTNEIRGMQFEIVFVGNSNNLYIVNVSNGSRMGIVGSTTDRQLIKFGSPFSLTRNNDNIFHMFTKEKFVLSPGNNAISITGTDLFDIEFNLRFYYK